MTTPRARRPALKYPPGSGRHWADNRWVDANGFEILPEGYHERLAQELVDNLRAHTTDPDYEKKRFAKLTEDGKGWTI